MLNYPFDYLKWMIFFDFYNILLQILIHHYYYILFLFHFFLHLNILLQILIHHHYNILLLYLNISTLPPRPAEARAEGPSADEHGQTRRPVHAIRRPVRHDGNVWGNADRDRKEVGEMKKKHYLWLSGSPSTIKWNCKLFCNE